MGNNSSRKAAQAPDPAPTHIIDNCKRLNELQLILEEAMKCFIATYCELDPVYFMPYDMLNSAWKSYCKIDQQLFEKYKELLSYDIKVKFPIPLNFYYNNSSRPVLCSGIRLKKWPGEP